MRGDRLGLHRPERRRQDHADQADPRHARARRGPVRLGTNVQVAYFDQLREQLDPGEDAVRDHQPGLGLGGDRRRSASTS